MSSFDDELLLDAEEDAKAVAYIREHLKREQTDKFTDDILYYFIDVMVEYYADSGILDDDPDAEAFIDVNLYEVAAYIAEKAKKEGVCTVDAEELIPIVEYYMDFEESL